MQRDGLYYMRQNKRKRAMQECNPSGIYLTDWNGRAPVQ
jgi:hypothetical protein